MPIKDAVLQRYLMQDTQAPNRRAKEAQLRQGFAECFSNALCAVLFCSSI
jgi:hypothetical protein